MKTQFAVVALAVAGALTMASSTVSAADAAIDPQQLLKRLEQQQQQIDELKKLVEANADADKADASDTWLGGYGELHHSNYEQKAADFDLHRFVLFIGHKFDDKLRFFSELEIEHSLAGEGKKGEVELEQAFIEYQVNADFSWKTGLYLVPVGIINETHEPATFYGVERNKVESDIVPSTWWEAGLGANWHVSESFTVEGMASSGLKVGADYKIRSGRQKVSEAVGEDLAVTGRVQYNGVPGLQLAASVQYQQDITQGLQAESAPATLLEAHGIYAVGGFTLRALYAGWDIDSDAAETLGRDKQKGWYVEPSFRFNDSVGVFVRHSNWDTEAGSSADSARKSMHVGVNYWLHPQVVLKADYEKQSGNKDDAGADFDDKGINIGFGYQF